MSKPGHELEDSQSYAKRLRMTAARLPKSLIKKILAKMKANIVAIVESKGGHTKLD